MKKQLAISVFLLTFSNVGFAQAQEQAIDKMFKAINIEKHMNSGFEAMLPVAEQMAARYKLNEQEKAELLDIYRSWFEKDIDRTKMMNQIKQLYSETFSEFEIDQITKFYQSKVGQKFLAKSPELMRLGAQIGMAEAQSKQQFLRMRLQSFLEKHKNK